MLGLALEVGIGFGGWDRPWGLGPWSLALNPETDSKDYDYTGGPNANLLYYSKT